MNNRFLNGGEKNLRLRKYRRLYNSQRIKILGLSTNIARLKASKQKLSEKIGEHAKRGDVSAIVHNLNYAYEKGLLSGKSKVLQFIGDITKNLTRKSPRYFKYTKQL